MKSNFMMQGIVDDVGLIQKLFIENKNDSAFNVHKLQYYLNMNV
jgi:hypothetical protein